MREGELDTEGVGEGEGVGEKEEEGVLDSEGVGEEEEEKEEEGVGEAGAEMQGAQRPSGLSHQAGKGQGKRLFLISIKYPGSV